MSTLFYDNTAAPKTIKSVFAHLDSLVNAIDKLEKDGHNDIVVTSPLPRHDLEDLIYKGRPSPVRWFTLTGSIFGGSMGFSLMALTHLNWAMIIPAGKPLVSIPAFIVIAFECTVLWGCFFTLIGMVIMSRLPTASNLQNEVKDPRFSDDKFGLIVNSVKTPEEAVAIAEMLEYEGAMEVINGYAELEFRPLVVVEEVLPEDVEPDSIKGVPGFAALALFLTVMLFGAIFGVKMLFDFTIAGNMDDGNYSYNKSAVAPTYRVDD